MNRNSIRSLAATAVLAAAFCLLHAKPQSTMVLDEGRAGQSSLARSATSHRTSSRADTKCGTQAARHASLKGMKFGRPPQGYLFVISPHFIVHYDTTGPNKVARAYAESTSVYAEHCWAVQIDTLGWAPPPPDGDNGGDSTFDIYILADTTAHGTTYCEDPYPNPYTDGYTSYVTVDTGMSWDYLRGTVAHEFQHASQYRYSRVDADWWSENTSTWMEDVCYDDIDSYVDGLSADTSSLKMPNLAITDTISDYEYTGGIWPMFLAEYYNLGCPRRCWELMGTQAGENTLPAIDSTLRTFYLSDLATALKKYAVWRYFAGPERGDQLYHFSESSNWPASQILRSHGTYPASGSQGSYPPSGPGGASYVEFTSASDILNLGFDGQNGYNWSTFALGVRSLHPSVEKEIGLDQNAYGTAHLPTANKSRLALVTAVTQWSSPANGLGFSYQADTQSVGLDWARRYSGQEDLPDKPLAMAVDGHSNVYVTGVIDHRGSGDLAGDYGTIKYDSAGSQQWTRTYNGPGDGMDQALAMAVDTIGNVYVTGSSDGAAADTNYDFATIKYDSAGNEQWVMRYASPGNNYEHGLAIAVDYPGNVYVTGWSGDTTSSADDYVTIKYNSAGTEQWVRRYDGPGAVPWDDASAIGVDRYGNVCVTGKSVGSAGNCDYATVKYDSAGDEQWVARYGSQSNGYDGALALVVDGQGSVYVSGESDSLPASVRDIVTIKYDSAGDEQWRRRYPGPLYRGSYGPRYLTMAIDPQSNVYVAGNNNYGCVTIKYNSAGVEQWARVYGGLGGKCATGIAVDEQGSVYVTGYGPGPNYYDDYVILKYDSVGIQQWVGRYNGPADSDDWATGIGISRLDEVLVTGFSCSPGTHEYATVKFVVPNSQPLIATKPRNLHLIMHQNQIEDTVLSVFNEGDATMSWILEENPDAEWISEDPTGDSLSPGLWTDVAVRVNTAGLAPGSYCTNLVLINNDPNEGQRKVSVEIRVLPGTGVSDGFARPAVPKTFALENSLPNPFRTQILIRYAVPRPSRVRLAVYDCSGALVRNLRAGVDQTGYYQAVWDGRDAQGRQVAKGVYLCRLQADDFTATRKMSKVGRSK